MIKKLNIDKKTTEYSIFFIYNEDPKKSFKFLTAHKLIDCEFDNFKKDLKSAYGLTFYYIGIKKIVALITPKGGSMGGIDLFGTVAHEALHVAIYTYPKKSRLVLKGRGSFQSEEAFVFYYESIYVKMMSILIKEMVNKDIEI